MIIIKIKPAEFEDILFVARNMRPCDRDECFAQRWNDDPIEFAMDVYRCPGIKWAVVCDRVPITIGGLIFNAPKVAQSFMFSTSGGAPEHLPQAWLKISKHSLKLFREVFDKTDIQRIEVSIIEAKKAAQGWVERMGFRLESVLSKKGKNGEAFILSVMLKGN